MVLPRDISESEDWHYHRIFQRIVSASLRRSGPAGSDHAGAVCNAARLHSQDSANDLSVAVGKTVLVDTAWPIKRVAIGLGDIAEVHAHQPDRDHGEWQDRR